MSVTWNLNLKTSLKILCGKINLYKSELSRKKEKGLVFLFMKAQTFHYLLDFSHCLTSTFVQSLLLNLNTHHSWIVRSLWPRNSFKYQIYNKRSETAKNNCEYQRVSTFEKRNRGKTRSAFFSCAGKKNSLHLAQFCADFSLVQFRLQKFHLPVLKMPMYGRHWERPDTRIYDYNITGEHYYSKPPKPTYSSSLSELNRTSRSKQYFHIYTITYFL